MIDTQFRVLYRQFLFRVIDLEMLSPAAAGDASRMLGQFTALPVMFGMLFGLGALLADARTIVGYGFQHALISTTMLAVGLFGVLSWDSIFPNRRDVMVLAPLPVRGRTVFAAKIAASAAVVSVTAAALNGPVSLLLPIAFGPDSNNLLDLILSPQPYRTFAAFWFTIAAASIFVFGALLCLQGFAAWFLSRALFLRASAWMQIASFGILLLVYFLQPSFSTPADFADPQNADALARLPSYWFLAMFQQLNGWGDPALAPLARRAWTGLLFTLGGAALACAFAYVRTIHRIAEEPDIAPIRRAAWLPRFGGPFSTAIAQFSARSLLRSRQHRLILAFYLGVGFTITILFMKAPAATQPLIASAIAMLGAWIVGTRVVFSIPLDLRANWVFQIVPLPDAKRCLSARRVALLALALLPVCIGIVAVFATRYPPRTAVNHISMLGLLGVFIVEVCLYGPQKLPFTCSWLPGRSNFHMMFLLCAGLFLLFALAARLEAKAAARNEITAITVATFAIACAALGWVNRRRALDQGAPKFEETSTEVIISMNLRGRGAS